MARLVSAPKEWRAVETLRRRRRRLEVDEPIKARGDQFDEAEDHLVVIEVDSGEVVATCPLRTGLKAALHAGYASAELFDLAVVEGLRNELVEVGQICVDHAHRTVAVLDLLWRGIAIYAEAFKARYVLGCSSVERADTATAAALWLRFAPDYLAPPELRVDPLAERACPLNSVAELGPSLPMLLVAALARGAWICGPPAWEPEFHRASLLTVLDRDRSLPRPVRVLFGNPSEAVLPGPSFALR